MIDLCEYAVSTGDKIGADETEAQWVRTISIGVEAESNHISQASKTRNEGMRIRVIKDKALGSFFTYKMDNHSIERAVEKAFLVKLGQVAGAAVLDVGVESFYFLKERCAWIGRADAEGDHFGRELFDECDGLLNGLLVVARHAEHHVGVDADLILMSQGQQLFGLFHPDALLDLVENLLNA